MPFLTGLKVQYLTPQRWVLLEPLVYKRAEAGSGAITVPAGFTTDFASVPRMPVFYMLCGNTGHRAAVLHDYLYSTQVVSRKEADRLFREALREDGVSLPIRWIMWLGVRLGGGPAWLKRDGGENILS